MGPLPAPCWWPISLPARCPTAAKSSFGSILLQNSGGAVAIWEISGTGIIGGGTLANPGPAWHA
jgi:hypothetical protein